MDERVPINGLPPGYAQGLGLGLSPHPLSAIGAGGSRPQQPGAHFPSATSPFGVVSALQQHHSTSLSQVPTSVGGVSTGSVGAYGLPTRPQTPVSSSQTQQPQQPLYVPALLAAPSPISAGATGLSSKLDYAAAGPPSGLTPGPYGTMSGLNLGASGGTYPMPPFGGAPVLYHPSPTAPMAGYISSSYATQQALLNAQAANSLALPPPSYYGQAPSITPSPSPLYSPAPSIDGMSEGMAAKMLLSQTHTGHSHIQQGSTGGNFKANPQLHSSSFLATSSSSASVILPGQLTSPLHGGSFQSMTPGVTPGVTPSPAPSTPATPTLQKPTPTKAVKGGINPLFSADHLFGHQTYPNQMSGAQGLQANSLHSSAGPQRVSPHPGLTGLQRPTLLHPSSTTVVKRERASPVMKREGPSPHSISSSRTTNGRSTPIGGGPVTPTPIHPVLIKPKAEMPAKPKAILPKPQPLLATAQGYPYRPMMKMEAPSVGSALSHPGILNLPVLGSGLSGLRSITGHPSALSPHTPSALSNHQSAAFSHPLSQITSISYSSSLSQSSRLTTSTTASSNSSSTTLSSHSGQSTHHLASSAVVSSATLSTSSSPVPSSTASASAAAAAAHAAFAAAGYHPAYAAAAAAAVFHQQQELTIGGQQTLEGHRQMPTALMTQSRNSHSMPLRLPEPSLCSSGGGSFVSHLNSLSKVITATFGQPEQMSINHQKLAQISQQSVIAAVAQQHKEIEKRKEREQKEREKKKEKQKDRGSNREVIVIKEEESQDDSKHNVFRQAASASSSTTAAAATHSSFNAFGYMTSSIATASTPIPASCLDTHSSRSRASTPATVIDKGDSKSSSATSLATSVASSGSGSQNLHRDRERPDSPAGYQHQDERINDSPPVLQNATVGTAKKKRKGLLLPNRQENKLHKGGILSSTVGIASNAASRGSIKDVYSFESEGDDTTAASLPSGRTAPAFRSKPSFPFASTGSGSHRKRALVADEVAQTKFPAVTESCARATIYTRKAAYDMFDFLASRHRRPPRGEHDSDDDSDDDDHGEEVSMRQRRIDKDLHMVMQFYSLKETARHTVGVYRSKIHRRGVFAKRVIEAGEMVIEYSGELIRAVLTDKRENAYKARGIDCYMFKIDEDEVVDATMHGNAARFINHSCDPNCYSKCIEIFGKKHIVIYSQRRIRIGEELTYDYKFPKEEVKVPCTCGARKCRRYLN